MGFLNFPDRIRVCFASGSDSQAVQFKLNVFFLQLFGIHRILTSLTTLSSVVYLNPSRVFKEPNFLPSLARLVFVFKVTSFKLINKHG